MGMEPFELLGRLGSSRPQYRHWHRDSWDGLAGLAGPWLDLTRPSIVNHANHFLPQPYPAIPILYHSHLTCCSSSASASGLACSATLPIPHRFFATWSRLVPRCSEDGELVTKYELPRTTTHLPQGP